MSPDSADYDGRTPLHLATSENQEAVVQHLVEKGVQLSPKDRWGNTPLDDAIRFGHGSIQHLLENAIGQMKHDQPLLLAAINHN